jgi:hypothetical protein
MVTAVLLGLPPDRCWIDPPSAGAYLPGAMLTLRAGVEHGVAAPRRTLRMELREAGDVVAEQELAVSVISPSRPIELALALPESAGHEYVLVLEVANVRVSWAITVPEQTVDARFVLAQPIVRRGEVLRACIRTASIALNTGVAYGFERWDGVRWLEVDPFDGESGAWAAIGLMIPARTDWPEHVRVPERTQPGRHRITKWVSAEQRGIGEVRIHGEFAVLDGPAVDYRTLLSKGAWMGIRPGAERAAVRATFGDPDERDDKNHVWRYGDLRLRFGGDTLEAFFGEVFDDDLVDELAWEARTGAWTSQLECGARLVVEHKHSGSFVGRHEFQIVR